MFDEANSNNISRLIPALYGEIFATKIYVSQILNNLVFVMLSNISPPKVWRLYGQVTNKVYIKLGHGLLIREQFSLFEVY